VIDLATVLADTVVSFCGKHFLASIPEIAETVAATIWLRNAFPELATGFGTPITNRKGYDLSRTTTHYGPEPTFVLAKAYK